MIKHTIYLVNGETETKYYKSVRDSQEGFCKEFKRDEVKDVKIKFVREEK